LTSGSRVFRPGASLRRPESEPHPSPPDPSYAAEVASLAAFAPSIQQNLFSSPPCQPIAPPFLSGCGGPAMPWADFPTGRQDLAWVSAESSAAQRDHRVALRQ